MTHPTADPRGTNSAPDATVPKGVAGPDAPPAPAAPPEPAAPGGLPAAEPRQRWRLTFAREPVPTDAVGRASIDAWQDALAASRLPLAGLEPGGPGRARIAFAAPLPAAASGEAELADVWLLERRPRWALREGLADRMPVAHRWIDAENVWLGAPALAGRVVAADWRVGLGIDPGGGLDRLASAARDLLAARTLPRTRLKGTTEKRYDLRPLLTDLAIEGSAGGVVLRIRTRFEPDAGSGRPEEVVAALAEAAGCAIAIGAITRERLILAEGPASPALPSLPARGSPRRR